MENFLQRFKKNNPCKTLVIAEAGVHHGCNIETGKRIIDAAAKASADVIKFQTYKADTLVTQWAPTYWQIPDENRKITQFDCFKERDHFDFEDYQALNMYALEKGIIFSSTPFDIQAVHWLEKLNIPFWKIASGDINNFPLLEEVAKTKKPILLSTGASYFNEIRETVDFLQSKGIRDLALLHCNLAYPTLNNEANLSRIIELKKAFPELIIGYSDHTIPNGTITIPVLAVAFGAKIIEKHFTLDRTILEDDHYHSLDPYLLEEMIKEIKIAEDATGNFREITDSEIPARNNARRSIVASRFISKGDIITDELIMPKRPGGGISPSQMSKVLGRKANRAIEKDQQIHLDFLE